MDRQWFLCSVEQYPDDATQRSQIADNLVLQQPRCKYWGSWLVWLPIIPRVGDTVQFRGRQAQVTRVVLRPDTKSETGLLDAADGLIDADLYIHDHVVPDLFESHYTDVRSSEGENYALRGRDLEYFTWSLRHSVYLLESQDELPHYERWYSRIRPVVGDMIAVRERRWRVVGVELSSPNEAVDGWLNLEAEAG